MERAPKLQVVSKQYTPIMLTPDSVPKKAAQQGNSSYTRSRNNLRNITPWKINMEPTNHPFRKENDLPNLDDYVPC